MHISWVDIDTVNQILIYTPFSFVFHNFDLFFSFVLTNNLQLILTHTQISYPKLSVWYKSIRRSDTTGTALRHYVGRLGLVISTVLVNGPDS